MAVAEVMQDLLDCAEQALTDADRLPGRVELSPGPEVVWDDCSCEGLLYVRVNPVAPGPVQGGCGVVVLRVSFFVGVLRCAATVKDSGAAPTAAELTADTLDELADMETLLTALNCCFRRNGDRPGVTVGSWSPLLQGDCHGGEWQVDVVVNVPCGCADDG